MEKTVLPIHFEDRSAQEFERLCFAYLFLIYDWKTLEWLGQTGNDHGRDIIGTLKNEDKGKNTYCIQCANYRLLPFRKAKTDIDKVTSSPKNIPYGFTIICGGKVSANMRKRIKQYAKGKGLKDVSVWSGPEFEEMLRRNTPELIKRFVKGEEFPDAVSELKKRFSKDSRLKMVGEEVTFKPHDYIVDKFYCKAEIKYGKNAKTKFHHEVDIKALKDHVDRYYYYNNNYNAEFLPVSGFSENYDRPRMLKSFPHAEGVIGGVLDGVNRIPISLSTLRKGNTKTLIYDVYINARFYNGELKGEQYMNGCFLRMNTQTHKAIIEMQIPTGESRDIIKLSWYASLGDQVTKLGDMDEIVDGTIDLGDKYGKVTIIKTQEKLSTIWTIERTIETGETFKLRWIHQKK